MSTQPDPGPGARPLTRAAHRASEVLVTRTVHARNAPGAQPSPTRAAHPTIVPRAPFAVEYT